MIQIISGVKGKGKTKFLIQKANEEVKAANGSVVYLDKNNKHMYELSNRIRLINVGDFPIDTYDAFIGFICGLISTFWHRSSRRSGRKLQTPMARTLPFR